MGPEKYDKLNDIKADIVATFKNGEFKFYGLKPALIGIKDKDDSSENCELCLEEKEFCGLALTRNQKKMNYEEDKRAKYEMDNLSKQNIKLDFGNAILTSLTNELLAKNDKSIIPETQNHETEDIIPLELCHVDEVKEPKPLIVFYYECPITSDKCQKWRSIEDVYAHVEAHHRMPKDVLERTGLKITEKILK